jgi:hypothetical protein
MSVATSVAALVASQDDRDGPLAARGARPRDAGGRGKKFLAAIRGAYDGRGFLPRSLSRRARGLLWRVS